MTGEIKLVYKSNQQIADRVLYRDIKHRKAIVNHWQKIHGDNISLFYIQIAPGKPKSNG